MTAEERFIQEELAAFSKYLEDLLRDRLTVRNINYTDDLLNSVATEVAANELKLYFNDSGRFHDMGAGRGYSKGKFLGAEDRAALLKGRKPSKWYSRPAYGATYGTLVENLSNKFIRGTKEEVLAAYYAGR